jgi:hypothetical protein
MSATSINEGYVRYEDGFLKKGGGGGDCCVQKVLEVDNFGGVYLSEIRTSYVEEKKGGSSPGRSPIEGWWGVGGYRSVCVEVLRFDVGTDGMGVLDGVDGFFDKKDEEVSTTWISQIELSTYSTSSTHLLWLRNDFTFSYYIHEDSMIPKKKNELIFAAFGEPDYSDLPKTDHHIRYPISLFRCRNISPIRIRPIATTQRDGRTW